MRRLMTFVCSILTACGGGDTAKTYTFTPGSPASDMYRIDTTDSKGYNIGAGRQTVSFMFRSDGYFSQNPEGHFAIMLRFNADAANETPSRLEGNGLVIGNLTGYFNPETRHAGNPLAPAATIETWYHGWVPNSFGNDLLPGSFGPVMQDGVDYEFIVNSDVLADNSSWVSYSIRQGNSIIYQMSPIPDGNTWFDRTRTGVAMGHVFPSSNTNWVLHISNLEVKWAPLK